MELKSTDHTVREDIIDISRYWSAIKRKSPYILVVAMLLAVASYMVSREIPPTYQATATLLIEAKQNKAISIEEIVGIDSSKQEYYQTQFEILQSNRIAQKVIEQYQLEKNPEFNGDGYFFSIKHLILSQIYQLRDIALSAIPVDQNSETSGDNQSLIEIEEQAQMRRLVLTNFKNKLTISPIRKTQLVNITFRSYNPRTASALANAVGQAYIENNIEARMLVTQEASLWLNSKLSELESQLRASETRLTDFQREQGLINTQGIDSLQTNELNYLTSQIANARDRRLAAESLYSTLRQNKSSDLGSLYAITEISNHPQIRDLRYQELQQEKIVSELAERYGPKHDKMVQAKAQLASIRTKSKRVVAQLAKGIEKEYIGAKRQEAALIAELNNKKGEFQNLSIQRTEYEKLERDVLNDRKLYDQFLSRQKETSITSDYQSALARFTDHAMTPLNPTAPNKLKITIIGFIATIFVLVTIVVLRESVRSDLELPSDIDNKIGFSPIGAIPKLKRSLLKNRNNDIEHFINQTNTPFSESIRSLRTRLLLNTANSKRKRFSVTSPLPGEGKSTVATNLAISLAKMENVLLIDADLRRPTIGKVFNFSMSKPGLTNHLLMGEPLENCLHKHAESGVTVLPSGFLPPNPQELLAASQFEKLLSLLDQKFDRIIIDCPPTLVVSDALFMGRLCEATLVVVKAKSTKVSLVKKTLAELIKHDIKIDGLVLNQITQKSSTTNHAYYQSYGYAADKTSAQKSS